MIFFTADKIITADGFDLFVLCLQLRVRLILFFVRLISDNLILFVGKPTIKLIQFYSDRITMNQNDFSGDYSSEESVVDDIEKDADYIESSSSSNSTETEFTVENGTEGQTENENEEVIVDFIDFDKWQNLSMEPIPKKKTNSDVWNFFGNLKKDNVIFQPLKKRYFCRPCFDEHKFKR